MSRMNIVVVESPAKAKTINKYLGRDYKVVASYGHIRDLPAKDGSVLPDDDFAMSWEVDGKSEKHIRAIAEAVRGADKLFLATDPDREGEAISWHVLEELKGRRAIGVRGRFVDDAGRARGRFRAYAPLVVLAAGARHTPGILKRSWLRARAIGRGLHTHPNAKVVGLFDRPLDPWIGTHQAFHIHHFREQGILIGYAAVPPGLLAGALPGVGEENAAWMRQYNHMLTAATLVEDEGEGRVVLGPDRQPYMLFDLSPRDLETVHRGVALTAELLFAAGARRVLLPFADLPLLEGPDQLHLIHERPPVPDTVELMTVHIMGTARMATDPQRGATDASGAVHDTDGLVVADASVLPSSIGVNPQETIIALALRNAERWLEAHGVARRRAAAAR